MNRMHHIALAAALALVACGKKDSGGDKDKSSSDKAAPKVAIDVAGVNALVPAALKDKLVFEQRDIVLKQGKHATTYTVAAPKNWKQENEMFGGLKADDKGGFFSRMSVGTDCNGMCEPKDWAVESDKAQFARRAKDGKVSKDEKKPDGRTMIVATDNPPLTTVVVASWKSGASNYMLCYADLDEAIKDAAPAFEKACQAINVSGGD